MKALFQPVLDYTHWLHGKWPAGTVEKLPEVKEDGTTNVPGIRVVGDLTGVPLLKFSLDTGTKAVNGIMAEHDFQKGKADDVLDIAIIGAGVSGMAAGVQASKAGLNYKIFEASQAFSTITNFPKGKPIYTYPTDMTPEGDLQVSAEIKEDLLDELQQQVDAAGVELTFNKIDRIERKGGVLYLHHGKGLEPTKTQRVIVAIGRSGNFRKMGVPGEDLDKVYNRLHDPKDFCGKSVLVVGGGDSALETAIALGACGSKVTLAYRKIEFSRPKPGNIEKLNALAADPEASVQIDKPVSERVTTAASSEMRGDKPAGSVEIKFETAPTSISDSEVVLKGPDGEQTIPNDAVFSMIGREAPLDFFRRSNIRIIGETTPVGWVFLGLFMLFCIFVYTWKGGAATETWLDPWPGNTPQLTAALGEWFKGQVADRTTLIGTLVVSMKGRAFYYTLLYSLCVVIFGLMRMQRRKTPYVKVQTSVLMAVQVVPLFLLPELILPWMGYNGWFDSGFMRTVADNLFELYISPEAYAAAQWPDWGHPRAYWRAYGFILAWPLMVYNIFTSTPMWWWITIGIVQTFVLIPILIYYFGKGAYCGWVCSCGALAETLGDTQRHKMPHGPIWNKLNMIGQFFLLCAFVLLAVRIWGWMDPQSWAAASFDFFLEGKTKAADGNTVLSWWAPLSYKWFVDVLFGGVLGVGLYFKYSGRVWCRFACPLAALMHIYARFTTFRIFPDKSKCISCNVCTSVCHQGIDIMNFANKGIPMEDPECVRCSACVQGCPTGVLTFGRTKADGEIVFDSLPGSLVQMAEKKKAE